MLPVALDAMGGDRAPDEIVAGAHRAVAELGVPILLVGRPEVLEPLAGDLEVLPASEVIAMDADPGSSVRRLKDSSLVRAAEAVRDGLAIPADLNVGVTVHTVVGVSVLLLALLRLGVRITRGAPRVPENEPAPLKFVANATHILLYAFMIAIPLGGLAAWAGGIKQAAPIHGLAANLLFVLVLIHIAGALYQRFVLKTDVMSRMAIPEK